jgi:uncharacterized membrane-anchored protein YitT (DUF2179 family)
MAMAFSVNSSTGGTDILAKISNKYFDLPMGISLLIIDSFIGVAAGSVYDLKIGMYSIISVILNGLIIDFVMKTLRTNNILTIISDKPDEIINYIFNNLDRGASIIKGQGAYSKKEKDFIYLAVSKRQKNEVIKNINKIDPYAFIIVSETSDVVGYGFTNPKN